MEEINAYLRQQENYIIPTVLPENMAWSPSNACALELANIMYMGIK
jgi:hypothetical protein